MRVGVGVLHGMGRQQRMGSEERMAAKWGAQGKREARRIERRGRVGIIRVRMGTAAVEVEVRLIA